MAMGKNKINSMAFLCLGCLKKQINVGADDRSERSLEFRG